MLFWLVVVVVVVIAVLIYVNVKKRMAAASASSKTVKSCAFCSEEIPIDATVCKYCGRVVISSS